MDFINHITLLAAGATTLAVQIMKLKLFPPSFANRYPVPTNLAVSLIATGVIYYTNWLPLHTVGDWLGTFGVIAVVAAMTYNHVLGQWGELKSSENGTPTVTPGKVI